jgi:hypothetical protein
VTYSSFATDANNLLCPYPNCDKHGICRAHVGLIPEAMLDELDFGRIRRYFQIRSRLGTLIETTGAPPSSPHPAPVAEGSSQGPSAPLSEAASRPPDELPPASKVNGPLGTFTPEGGNAASPLHVVCAWCKSVIVQGDESQPVSHGCCPGCVEKVGAENIEAAS